MLNKMKNLVLQEEGQGATEYGLILAAIVAVVATAIWALGDKIKGFFTNINLDKPTN